MLHMNDSWGYGLTKAGQLCTCVIFAVLVLFSSSAQAENDWQFWKTIGADIELNERWTLKVEEESRISNGFDKLVYEHGDLGVAYKATDWIDLSLHYRYIAFWSNNDWENESRPHFNITFHTLWKGLELSNRNRMELRMIGETKDFWRYRNELRVALPLETERLHFAPFVSGEYFADLDQSAYNFNRFKAGLEIDLPKDIEGEVYYLFQDVDSRWTESPENGIGAQIILNF